MTAVSAKNPLVARGGPAEPPGTPPAAPPEPPEIGPVESKVRSDIEALVTAHPMGEALSEMAFTLARTLDRGAGLAVAAVNRELRANLIELARLGVDGDDDIDDQLSTPVLPTEIRDEEES
jgi:hypothetical protein